MVVENEHALPRFTLEEYIAYLKAPQWAKDGYDDEAQYVADVCSKVKSWHAQSEEHFKEVKEIWKLCYEELKRSPKKALGGTSEDAIAKSKVPILKNAMRKEIAALYAGQYEPVLKSLMEPTQPMVALANRYLKVELKINKWNSLKFQLGVDGFVCDLWVMKVYTDNAEPGPFGKEERLVFDRIDPMKCCFDPKASSMRWSDMDFFIVWDEMDPGVAMTRFPDKIFEIESLSEGERAGTEQPGFLWVTPGTRKRWSENASRKRVQIKECWLHDERMQFRAHKYTDPDTQEEKIEIDEDGYVVGSWEKAFPYGRMIVTASDKVVLRDIPNPYWHKSIPFIYCPLNPVPGGDLLTAGKAAAILGIDRKVNDIESRIHSYAQSETERPMEADVGAFPSNIAWYDTTGKSRSILMKNQGKTFTRRPPVEIPAFLGPYVARMLAYKDEIAGQPGVLGGQIPEGGQLSAETLNMVQGTSMSVLSMESVQIAEAMREVGEKALWLMRETYKEGLSAVITLPDGTKKTVEWNHDDIPDDVFVDVDIAANTPGGRQMLMNQALTWKRMGVVDRPYVLQASGIDNWEEIDARMLDREYKEIIAQGYGRSLGVQVKKYQKEADEGPGPVGKV